MIRNPMIHDFLNRNGIIIERARRSGKSLTAVERNIILTGRDIAFERGLSPHQVSIFEMQGERQWEEIMKPIHVVFAHYNDPYEEIPASPSYFITESNHPSLPVNGNVGADQLLAAGIEIPKTPTFDKWVKGGKKILRATAKAAVLLLMFSLRSFAQMPVRGQAPNACDFNPDGADCNAIQVRQQEVADLASIPDKRIQEEMWGHASVVSFVNSPDQPEEGKGYAVDGMIVVQKIKGGYLLQPMYVSGDGLNTIFFTVFLKSKSSLPLNTPLTGEVKYVGHKSYLAMNGYERTIHAFIDLQK